MFKRVERKRKRQEKAEELGLDENTRQIMGLNDTDSDESDSLSEQGASAQSSDSDSDIGEDGIEDEDVTLEDEGTNEEPPISVEEALKDPIYLISLGPTVYGCVSCKGKLIKNAGMVAAHKNASVHNRRFKQFRQLSADVDPCSNAWELLKAFESASNTRQVDSQEPSKRALKRRAKQAVVREKRKRHKELKAKAVAKKGLEKLSKADGVIPLALSKANSRCSPEPQNQSVGKKPKLESTSSASKTRQKGGCEAEGQKHKKS